MTAKIQEFSKNPFTSSLNPFEEESDTNFENVDSSSKTILKLPNFTPRLIQSQIFRSSKHNIDNSLINSKRNDFLNSTNRFTDDLSSILIDIETNQISCSSIIRKIHESFSSNSNNNLLPQLLNALDLKAHDQMLNIESACHQEYQGFVDSLRELSSLEIILGDLRQQMHQINQGVEKSTNYLKLKCQEHARCLDSVHNIDRAVEELQMCLPILDQFARVKRNIAENRFFPALKMLEYLEHSQLPLISCYDFSVALSKQIPHIREIIKDKSEQQHKSFLENVRKLSVRLGAMAMNNVAERVGIVMDSGDEDVRDPFSACFQPAGSNVCNLDAVDQLEAEFEQALHVAVNQSNSKSKMAVHIEQRNNSSNCLEEMLDFGPLYRCLHIFSVLGQRAVFEKQYRSERRKQWQLTVVVSAAQQAAMRNYCEFFSSIVGFFVVEEFVFHALPSLVLRSDVDEMWTQTAGRLAHIFAHNLSSVDSREVVLRLKDACVLFTRTIQMLMPGHTSLTSGGNASSSSLKPLIDLIRNRYYQLLTKEWRAKFQEIFQSDNFSPIVLTNQDALHQLQSQLADQHSVDVHSPLPITLPYSLMVPRLCQAVVGFLDECGRFGRNLHADLSVTERQDELYKAAANQLFLQALKPSLQQQVAGCRDNLFQLVQLSVNMDHMEVQCRRLEAQLTAAGDLIGHHQQQQLGTNWSVEDSFPATSAATTFPPPSRLSPGLALFRDVRSEAESQIYSTVNSKIDSFFTLANYNWQTTAQLADLNTQLLQPSEYIVDTMEFLAATFRSFDCLPGKVFQTASQSACKYISQQLLKILLAPEVKSISEAALQQFSRDVTVCEQFSNSFSPPGSNPAGQSDSDDWLRMVFSDVRQLVDMALLSDYQTFVSRYTQSDSPFNRVSPSNVMKLLDKLKEAEKKPSGFFQGMRKPDNDRRRRLEEAQRQVKELHDSIYRS